MNPNAPPHRRERITEQDLETILARLAYSLAWLEYGLLDETSIREQWQQYVTSDDKNSEHYRYRAFVAFLAENLALDDANVDRYIQLAQIDDHQGMAQSALIQLIAWPGLSDAQLERLGNHPAFVSPVSQRRIERERLLRQLQSAPMSDELLERCIASRDTEVQREVLNKQGITRPQLERLLDDGATRAIRNMAKQQLNRRDRRL